MSGRCLILLCEADGRTTHHNGLVAAPVGMSRAEAEEVIGAVVDEVSEATEWNYTDVFERLRERGFDQLEFDVWWE